MGTTLTTKLCALVLMTSGSYSSAWNPGVGNESNTSGFSVDTQSRNDVVSFWHCVYQQSEGYENRINWTGSVAGGNPGTTSAAFKNDVQRRINYYRAMAGMSASIDMASTSTVELGGSTPAGAQPSASTTKENAAQQAALMRSRNHAQSGDPHDPPSNWNLDGAIARNGALHSSLAVQHYGPSAIDAYVSDDDAGLGGAANDDVAHRRYLLYSRIQEVATGDVTGDGSYPSANALYVRGNLLPAPDSPQYIAWPNAGYIPEPILPERWSLSFPNANFSSATVTMTNGGGNNVPLTVVSNTANFGDETIVWIPTSILSSDFDDQAFNVTISNIEIGGVLTNHSYTVTVINPDRLLESSDLSGSTSPPESGANYSFENVPHAEKYSFKVSSLTPSTWVEQANSSATIINQTSLSDSQLRSTNTSLATGRSLRLAFISNTETFSAVELDRSFIPRTGSTVDFYTRRGIMLSSTTWALQIRTGNGSWHDLKTLTNNNGSNYFPLDNNFISHSINIPSEFHNNSASLRIVYEKSSANTSYQLNQNSLVGVFTDDISLPNCDELKPLGTYNYAPDSLSFVSLNSSTAGEPLVIGKKYLLSFAVTVGSKDFPYGRALEVIPEGGDLLIPPTLSSLSLNSGTNITTSSLVTVNHSKEGGMPTHYKTSENASFTGAVWRTYTSVPVSTLSSGTGAKTVYFKLKNDNGESSSLSDTINYEESSTGGDIEHPGSVAATTSTFGKYAGFLSAADGSTLGYFPSIKVSKGGKLSAKLYFGSTVYSLKGVFDENGQYSSVITPRSGSPAAVDLQLEITSAGGYRITGTVTVGNQIANAVAVKAGVTNSQAGTYTLLVLREEDEASAPQGHGYGLMTVTTKGTAKVKGLLGDGSKWTAKCLVTPDGEMPLYAALYRKAGSLGGLVRFRNVAGVSDCDSELHWSKLGGFSIMRNLIGSRYRYTGARLITGAANTNPNVVAQVGAGNGLPAMNLDLEWAANNKISHADRKKVKVKVAIKTGLIKGTLTEGQIKSKMEGVIFQKQDLGAGLVYSKVGQPRSLLVVAESENN